MSELQEFMQELGEAAEMKNPFETTAAWVCWVRGQVRTMRRFRERIEMLEAQKNACGNTVSKVGKMREALEKAMEWAAGYPLGGAMDDIAATDVYQACEEALE